MKNTLGIFLVMIGVLIGWALCGFWNINPVNFINGSAHKKISSRDTSQKVITSLVTFPSLNKVVSDGQTLTDSDKSVLRRFRDSQRSEYSDNGSVVSITPTALPSDIIPHVPIDPCPDASFKVKDSIETALSDTVVLANGKTVIREDNVRMVYEMYSDGLLRKLVNQRFTFSPRHPLLLEKIIGTTSQTRDQYQIAIFGEKDVITGQWKAGVRGQIFFGDVGFYARPTLGLDTLFHPQLPLGVEYIIFRK